MAVIHAFLRLQVPSLCPPSPLCGFSPGLPSELQTTHTSCACPWATGIPVPCPSLPSQYTESTWHRPPASEAESQGAILVTPLLPPHPGHEEVVRPVQGSWRPPPFLSITAP